ncbi:hypothetical protein PIB30_107053, partial [Stylosanthes scabra]|nr:hypothetical protein [Stylosanthes scabra]
LLLDPLILVGSILHLIVVYYLVRFGILAEIIGLLKIHINNMIRQEQKLLGKEILDVKKHQMNIVTMGSSSSPQKYEPDQALMKIREQHANFSKVQRQLKEWTRNSTARECYTVWAHQQANPNLVEMPVHKVTKQIYDNTNNNRPMFYGFLKSDLPPSEIAPPQPKSKDPHNAPN